MKRVLIVGAMLAVALLSWPAASQAATHDYGSRRDELDRCRRSRQGLCVPALLCPLVTNTVNGGVGAPGTNAGFIETRPRQ